MLEVTYGQASHPGKAGQNNEDAMGVLVPVSPQRVRSHGWLFVVADGQGGIDLGEVASAKAVQVITEEFAGAQEGTSLAGLLPRIIQYANVAVHDEGLTPERRGRKMASTVVACALRYDQAYIANVGDSRCYLIRDRQATVLSQDHTWVHEQRKLGIFSEEEAANSNSRHILTRSLGPELFISADVNCITVRPGDVLVLSTDGLYAKLEDRELIRIAMQDSSADQIARDLVEYSIGVDGSDNSTVQVISIRAVESLEMYRARPYPRLGR